MVSRAPAPPQIGEQCLTLLRALDNTLVIDTAVYTSEAQRGRPK